MVQLVLVVSVLLPAFGIIILSAGKGSGSTGLFNHSPNTDKPNYTQATTIRHTVTKEDGN